MALAQPYLWQTPTVLAVRAILGKRHPKVVKESLRSAQELYLHLVATPSMRAFLQDGGTLTIATEHRAVEDIMELIAVGQRHFAEKYVQEAQRKILKIREMHPYVRWHFFGKLQTNKVKHIVRSFHCVETVASHRQADHIVAQDVQPESVFVQVNLGREPQKNGVAPDEAPTLIEYALRQGLPLRGLMAIPPKADAPAPHFRQLRALADQFALPYCQMGFSADYEIAIDCGATHLRLGTRIFGPLRS